MTNVFFVIELFELWNFRMKNDRNIIEICVFKNFIFDIFIDWLCLFLVIFVICVVIVLFVKKRYKRIVIDIVCEKFLILRKQKILNWTRKILRNTLRKKWILNCKNLILLKILRSILRRRKNVLISWKCLSITWRLTILKFEKVIRWIIFKIWFWISIKTFKILNLFLIEFHFTLKCDFDYVIFVYIICIIFDCIFQISRKIFNCDAFIEFSYLFTKFFIKNDSNYCKHDQFWHIKKNRITHENFDVFIELSSILNVFNNIIFDLHFFQNIRWMFFIFCY